MRIGILAPLVTAIREPQDGGSQAVVADVAAGLAARGHDVEVLAASGSSIEGVVVVDTGVDPESLRSDLVRPEARSAEASAASWRAFERAWAIARERAYDVIHNHSFDVPAITLGGRDAVHTLHLPFDERIAGAIAQARPAAVAAVSESQARAWGPQVDTILRNGVPTALIPWSPRASGPAVFAGRFSPEKGALEAIEIAARAGVPLVLIGSAYDPDYAARVESAARDAGARVEDGLPRAHLWARFADACAVLCPSRWDEPFGMVAAEAQAAGAPVIGFARGALPEIVEHGRTGALADDVPAAAEALRGVARFDRSACRERAERHLDLEATLDAHERLYAALR